MAIAVTIDGVAQTTLQPQWSISATVRGVDTFRGDVLSLDATNRPALDDDIVVTDGTFAVIGTPERIFGGKITIPTEVGFGGHGASIGIVTRITAESYKALPRRRAIYGSRPEESLKARLTWLVDNYFAVYGVTLHASQSTGDTVPARDYNNERGDVVLEELATLTSWPWDISYSKVLRMAAPGAVAAPFNVEDGGGISYVRGDAGRSDVEVTPTRNNYANYVIVQYNGSTQHEETFIASEVVSLPDEPGQTVFPLTYIHDANSGLITINGVANIDMAAAGITVEPWPESPSGWALFTPPQDFGTEILFGYSSKFAGVTFAKDDAEIAANELWDIVIQAQNVFSEALAQTLAEQYLAQRKQVRKAIRYPSEARGLFPGMAQSFTVAKRNLSSVEALITDVEHRHIKGQLVRRTVTAVEGAIVLAGGWRDPWNQSLSASSGSGAGLVTVSLPASSGSAGGGRMVYALTGSGEYGVKGSTWVAGSKLRVRLDRAKFGSTGTAYVWLRAFKAGVSVTARLRDMTTGAEATVGTSAAITSTEFAPAVFGVVISADIAWYEIQLLPSEDGTPVYVTGYVES